MSVAVAEQTRTLVVGKDSLGDINRGDVLVVDGIRKLVERTNLKGNIFTRYVEDGGIIVSEQYTRVGKKVDCAHGGVDSRDYCRSGDLIRKLGEALK